MNPFLGGIGIGMYLGFFVSLFIAPRPLKVWDVYLLGVYFVIILVGILF